LPGTILVSIGFPILFGVPLAFMCLLAPVLNSNAPQATPRIRTSKAQEDNAASQPATDGSMLGGCICSSVGLLWIAGTASLLLLRAKLNADFVRRNTIRLDYSMQHRQAVQYKKLLRCLDDLAPAKMFEIVPCGGGVFEQSSAASFRIELPRYLECNCEVYCLAVGGERYYLTPDCVLIFTGGDFFTLQYRKVSLATNNVRGWLRRTIYEYQWRHSRVDGGPDRRFKNNYQIPVPRKITEPLHQYGVITFHMGRDEFSVLTDTSGSLSGFEAAFQDWLAV
jgi:hypothetical protein